MTLREELLNQRLRFTRAVPPYDMVARPNYSSEIEITRIKLLGHDQNGPSLTGARFRFTQSDAYSLD